ncbi:MAG: TIGR02921 family PEP-CTERM protein [Ardenticatenaceae bacterium]|nr:TIGR02921 family PEP-CTERM protein [Anaerolineales bacterium]MCB8922420.1 TIGR02921 family PEP-CTERM protein [Ardenticatenaceae bacterium]MCB8991352.1 TIGR02921 family PEP-CTERM protein [Ardenticatenaceae bacterium]MCB9005574.1 TIGR02921 family PEP-CTERM protein [Ardenticatenaceae bacterium]
MKTFIRKYFDRRKWAKGLFWGWNIIFLAFMLLGFAPTVLPDMITAVQSQDIPASFFVYAAVLTLIPVFTVALGFWRLRHDPVRLFVLGYGVEGPLMLVLAVRFFIVQQATPAITLLLIVAALGIFTFLWQLLDTQKQEIGDQGLEIEQSPISNPQSPLLAHLRLIGMTLLLLIGLYTSVWIAFYALPLGVKGLSSIGDFFRELWRELSTLDWSTLQWSRVPFSVLGIILVIFTGALVIMLPVALSIIYGTTWWRSVKAVAAGYGRIRAMGLATAVTLIIAILFTWSLRQPQQQAFALLEEPPATLAETEALLTQEDVIREGLLNAYLAPHRYLSAVGEVRHIEYMYKDMLGFSIKQAQRVQAMYDAVARPLLYNPVHPLSPNRVSWQNTALVQEPQEAADLYLNYFDLPINEAEKDAVTQAARSTWLVDQARANWQEVDDREIHLTRQELTVTEHGDWAEMELYEVYRNQTTQRQEVVYYFSLPETAVITGVWLGTSDNRAERFAYQVAPRGAAQAVYRNEVRRSLDPALVEQIGPSQYRLRVFPIEPMRWDWDAEGQRSTLQDGPELHMWLTWQVMGVETEGWPLPYLAQKFNVYWDDDSVRLINGKEMDTAKEDWLPAILPSSAPITSVAHRVDFADGQTVLITPQTAVSPNLDNLHVAVVLDRSRSMELLADTVQSALSQLAAFDPAADVYLTASPVRGEAPSRTTVDALDAANILYFGGQNPAELLAQFSDLSAGENYDAIFVLTDGTGYELGEPDVAFPVPSAPVWMVHLDGRFPIGYDDATLTAVQASGGGSAGSVFQALTRLQTSRTGQGDVVDGYLWRVLPTAQARPESVGPLTTHASDDPFAALAARRIILSEMVAHRGQLDDVATLDALHVLAMEHGIITPYSSMIVLVTERQQELLDNLSDDPDRFDREFEAIGDTTGLAVTGVPEPEEWLLLGLAVLMLGWYAWKRNGETAVMRHS